MKALGTFFSFLRWDLLRELRRREAILNMILFAVLVLFLIDLGLSPLFDRVRGAVGVIGEGALAPRDLAVLENVEERMGPVLYWITVLFAGTVGLSQSFAAEREGGSLTAIVLAPVDLGVFYLAKVAATWIYVFLMELCLLGAYFILFPNHEVTSLAGAVPVLGLFSLVYMAAGVVLAAMTSALRRGGEVVLRILLLPLLLPIVYLTLRVEEGTFSTDVAAGVLGEPVLLWQYVAVASAVAAIYLTVGFLVFPKVFEE